MKISLAVFFGGRSVEHEVSIISGWQAISACNKEKFNVIPIYVSKQGLMYTGLAMDSVTAFKDIPGLLKNCNQITLVSDGAKVHIVKFPSTMFKNDLGIVDVALPVMHGTNGEDGTLQGFLEMVGLPYAGCDIVSSAVGMDKVMMKKLLKEHGIPVLDCKYFYMREWFENKDSIIEKIESIGYPVIVKPANLGSSVGIKKANDRLVLKEAIEFAGSFADKILVEHAITNLREINCSVIGDSSYVRASVCEEPISCDEILSYQDKYMGGGSKNSNSKGMSGSSRKIPADLSVEMTNAIKDMCCSTFKILCCGGVARVDCMIDNDNGEVYVNEINTIPGSLSFYLWEAAGTSFTDLINELVSLALKRSRERVALVFYYDNNILAMQGGTKGAKGTKK